MFAHAGSQHEDHDVDGLAVQSGPIQRALRTNDADYRMLEQTRRRATRMRESHALAERGARHSLPIQDVSKQRLENVVLEAWKSPYGKSDCVGCSLERWRDTECSPIQGVCKHVLFGFELRRGCGPGQRNPVAPSPTLDLGTIEPQLGRRRVSREQSLTYPASHGPRRNVEEPCGFFLVQASVSHDCCEGLGARKTRDHDLSRWRIPLRTRARAGLP